MSSNLGTLWIVSTPLGNPGDLSPRAKDALSNASLILAEDTRRSGILLSTVGITGKHFLSLHEHNERERIDKVLDMLRSGQNLALVSDAGTPLLSDPGFLLVRACRQQQMPVFPIPGPCAPVVALSASGFPPVPFAFLGFSPRKKNEQIAFFSPYSRIPATIIFFERKDRVPASLQTAYEVLGEREVCIARELTKTYEEFIYLKLSEYQSLPELLGEITILIAPSDVAQRDSEDFVLEMLAREKQHGGKPKEVAKRVCGMVQGWQTGEVYSLLQDKK